MKTVTILILTFLLAPCTVHAYDAGEETPSIESLKNTQTETHDQKVFELTAAQPDSTNKHELLKRVRERGTVRIIVTYNMEHSPERELNAGQQNAQRGQIAQMHEEFVNQLEQNGINVKINGNLNTYPVIFMSVDEESLQYLFESRKIKTIRIERFGTAF